MEKRIEPNRGESFTFLNESELPQGLDQNTILSTKEMALNQGLSATKCKAMAHRNQSCGAERPRLNRFQMDQFRMDAPSRFNQTSDYELGSARSQQDDSLFITTLRNKSKTSLRFYASPEVELVSTAKKAFLPRIQNYTKSGTFIELPKVNMILPLPPKVKLRPMQTSRIIGDLSNCKIITDTQDSINGAVTAQKIRTRNSLDPSCLPRTSRTSRGATATQNNNNHFKFEQITDDIKDTGSRLQQQSRPGRGTSNQTSEVRFTVEGSHTSPAPKERTTLESFISDQNAQQLNQMILTTIQDEQKAFESARKNHRVTDSAEFDSEQGNEVQGGKQNEDRKNLQIQGKHCHQSSEDDDDSDDDTVQERFSQEDFHSSEYCDKSEECSKAPCVMTREELIQKDCVILSLQEQLLELEVQQNNQQAQIVGLTRQLEAEEKKKKQKAIIFETENSRLQFQADASNFLTDNNHEDETVQQSAKTLLRKIKSQINGVENLNKSNNIPEPQRDLYDRLQEMLEQCLIVDNFNRDVDRSLLSYGQQTDNQLQEQQQHVEDFFYQSMAEHQNSQGGRPTDPHTDEVRKEISVSGHTRTETLPRGTAAVIEQHSYNTLTFGKTQQSNIKKFAALIDGGSSSEATARNLRYHQVEESSQDCSMSRGHGGLDLSSRSIIKTKSQIIEENDGKNEVVKEEAYIDEGSESDSLLFSQITQQ